MKKNLLGFSAFLFAIILSAFSIPQKTVPKVLGDYYWYEVDGSNAVGLPLSSTPDNITTAKTYVMGCDDASGDKCLVGFATQQSTPVAVPADNNENTIFKN